MSAVKSVDAVQRLVNPPYADLDFTTLARWIVAWKQNELPRH